MSRMVRLAALVAVLALASVACGGGAKATGLPTGPTPEPVAQGTVQVKNNIFDPKQTTIKAGQEVTWEFVGIQHNVEADDGSFNSHPGCSASGLDKCNKFGDPAYKRKFDKAGTYAYFCAIHGFKGGIGMAGTVVVS